MEQILSQNINLEFLKKDGSISDEVFKGMVGLPVDMGCNHKKNPN